VSEAQRIETPTERDIDRIAHQLIHAEEVVFRTLGRTLTGALDDLELLQRTLNANVIEREATYTLQALGIAFGKVFVNHNADFDWWMVEDEYGRDPAVRFKRTALLVFPQTMISKRIEDGTPIDVAAMYEGLLAQLASIRAENYAQE
jgi:hypothetical protein